MIKSNNKEYSFPQKVWIAVGVTALIVVMLLLLKATFSVLLLILAGSLIAVYFRGLSGLIQRKTHWKENVCLTISIAGSLLLITILFWLMGAKVQSQIAEMSDTLPNTIERTKEQLNQSSLGQKIFDKLSSQGTKTRYSR